MEANKNQKESVNQEQLNRSQGFFGDVRAYLSQDRQYLTLVTPAGRIRKHVNFFKSILGIEFTPKAKMPTALGARV